MNIKDFFNGFRPSRRVSLRSEPPNFSSGSTVASVTSAIRAAEGGQTRELFALYRDLVISGSHVQAEFSKRKLALLAQPMSILPADKDDRDDLAAAEACRQMVLDCENFTDGLIHLMDSCLWPVSVVEKIYQPGAGPRPGRVRLQYTLRRLEPVNHTLLCFAPRYFNAERGMRNEEAWEPDLKFYGLNEAGDIQYDVDRAMPADPMRHIVHRGHMLVGVRDNFGGPMRAIVYWWLLAGLGRDWFSRFMERYGSPFPVGHTDAADSAAVKLLQDAFSLSTKIGGLVVDHDTSIELKEAMTSGGADAHEKFLNVCHREISKVIVGQTLSGEAQPTGLGSGTANLQGEVREDVRGFDQQKLGETLRRQLFEPFLEINGLRGAAPKVMWGGLEPADAAALGALLVQLTQASLEPTDEAIPNLAERVGFGLQRKAPVAAPGFGLGVPLSATIPHSALRTPHFPDPTDPAVAAKAAALARAFQGALAPVRLAVLTAATPEEALRNLTALYPDWRPGRAAEICEEALQLCAAAGAAQKPPKRL